MPRSVEARSGRLIVGRLIPGDDLIRGLEQVCEAHGIRYAAVVFAYGSLSRASFKMLDRPPGEERARLVPHNVESRGEFIAGQGLVCRSAQGQRETHLHGCISDEQARVLGGHFVPDENPVYNNMDFLLQEIVGVVLTRAYDPVTDTVEMVLEQDVAG